MKKTDVLIIGSEGAGARAAIQAHDQDVKVTIISKGRIGRSGATVTAGMDIDVDSNSIKNILGMEGDPEDSREKFFEDIVIEGKYVNNQKIVEKHVEDAPVRVKEVIDWGMKVTGLLHGPGHRYPRGVYSSGNELMKALKRQVRKRNIEVVEDTMAMDLLVNEGKVVGVLCIDLQKGEIFPISAKVVILATGGCQHLYKVSTAPEELSGDGQAMAFRAGADLIDMEMVQFLPSCFITPPALSGLTFPFFMGQGVGSIQAWLLNRYGDRFMSRWDPENMERSTRDKLAIGVANEVFEGRGSPAGGVFYSLKHLPNNLVDYFPVWRNEPYLNSKWEFKGFKLKSLMEDMKNGFAPEVGPACHFYMGGVRVDENCRTTLPGLYACGEVAGGTHGGNRLTGNACTQILVQGFHAGDLAAKEAKEVEQPPVDQNQIDSLKEKYLDPLEKDDGHTVFDLKKDMQETASNSVGVLREGSRLEKTFGKIEDIKNQVNQVFVQKKNPRYNREWIEALQLKNMATIMEATALSAMTREESRGAHYRRDFPKMDNQAWLKNIVIKNAAGKMKVETVPLVITSFDPAKEAK